MRPIRSTIQQGVAVRRWGQRYLVAPRGDTQLPNAADHPVFRIERL
jgi:hypothetical protein